MGLHKILSLLEADDADVRIHAVKVVANLAAEGALLYLCRVFYVLICTFITIWLENFFVSSIFFFRI